MSTPNDGAEVRDEALRDILKSQYHASLAMLRGAIERCPDEVWESTEHVNAFWQIAYHALFFTHLYLQVVPEAFVPWKHHRGNVQHEDGIAGEVDPNSELPLIPETYSKEQVLAYWAFCDEMVDGAVDALDLGAQASGFYWYQVPKLEHQIINLRHLQHHAGQLIDRVRSAAGVGTPWVGARRR